ncbi:disulfide bond formation protein B [Sphingomonas sp. LB-2]|uniref:disulfide bond formation protein B n=1 Tax=Sphingomonas caeni TaxID=2984949 RepID=UPI002230E7AC|nr:disulfide bond formation protein B [Sphingomonas caeni]MCW3846595.1 disulfide bond formation protein B [Sphingomonas caeni]
MPRDGLTQARWLALLVPLALMGGALGSQFIGGLIPCEMCHWQRWPHYAAIGIAALAFVVPDRRLTTALVAVAALLIATSGAIGVFHAGVEYHWWPGITPCTATLKPGESGLDIIDRIQHGPMIRCDLPQWSLFGISLAGFNAIISLGSAVAIFALLLFRRARA